MESLSTRNQHNNIRTSPNANPNSSSNTPTELHQPNTEIKEQIPEQPPGFGQLFKQNIIRTIPTALSYDVSMGIFALGLLMTQWGDETSAPAITTMKAFVGFFVFAAMFASSPMISRGYTLINSHKTVIKKAKLLFQSENDKNDIDTFIAANRNTYTKIITLRDQINRIPRNVCIASLGFGLIPLIPMLSINPFFTALGQNENVSGSAQTFFYPNAISFIFSMPRLSLEFVFLAFKKQFITAPIALLVLTFTIGLEIFLNQLWGLTGVGVANGIGEVTTMLLFALYLAKSSDFKNYAFIRPFFDFHCSKNDWKQFLYFFRKSIPTIIASGTDTLMPFIIAIIAGKLRDPDALQEQNVATIYGIIGSWLNAATSQSTQMETSDLRVEIRKREWSYNNLYRPILAGLCVNLAVQSPFIIFAAASPAYFIEMLGSSADASKIHTLLGITILYNLLDNMRYITLLSSRALGNNTKSSIISSVSLWTGVIVMFALNSIIDLDVIDLPIIMGGAALIAATILLAQLPTTIKDAKKSDEPKTQMDLEANISNSDTQKLLPKPSCCEIKEILEEDGEYDQEVNTTDINVRIQALDKEINEEIVAEKIPKKSFFSWLCCNKTEHQDYVEIHDADNNEDEEPDNNNIQAGLSPK